MIRVRFSRQPRAFLSTLLVSLLFSCTTEEELPPVNEHVSSPMAVVSSSDQQYFYVLNGDFNREYASGSILMVKRDGSEKKGLPVPHYGRSLKVGGDRMLVAYDRNPEQGGVTYVDLYQVYNDTEMKLPVLKKRWEFEECRALNVTLRENYEYFGVACENGDLLLGSFDSGDLSQSTLKRARNTPGHVRRAMHIDTQRNILYSFVTDMSPIRSEDRVEKDVSHYDADQDKVVDGANDVPDSLEKERSLRQRLRDGSSPFQFQVIDLAAEKNKSTENSREFVFRGFDEVRTEELRFLYWTADSDEDEKKYFEDYIKSAEGNTEPTAAELEEFRQNYKYYRTNFWDAYPDPGSTDDRSFFLSHRGRGHSDDSPHANAAIRVTLRDGVEAANITDMSVLTKDIFNFEKVYGRKSHRLQKAGEDGVYHNDYTGGIGFTMVGADHYLLVNSFRSTEFDDEDRSYSLRSAKRKGDNFSAVEDNNSAVIHSSVAPLPETAFLFEFAASADIQNGAATGDTYVLSASFFNDSIILLKLEESQFTELQRFR